MTPDEPWLATLWPLVRTRLPAPPARVVEIGCGPLGGFVPMLRADGYDAVGIDPQAPAQPHYQRLEFERAEPLLEVDSSGRRLHLPPSRRRSSPCDDDPHADAGWAGARSPRLGLGKFDEQTSTWCFRAGLGPGGGEGGGGGGRG